MSGVTSSPFVKLCQFPDKPDNLANANVEVIKISVLLARLDPQGNQVMTVNQVSLVTPELQEFQLKLQPLLLPHLDARGVQQEPRVHLEPQAPKGHKVHPVHPDCPEGPE